MRHLGVVFRPAQVEGLAAVIFLRVFEDDKVRPLLAAQLRGLSGSADPANRLAVDQVRDSLEQLRQLRAELGAHRDGLRGGSAGGTAEPPSAPLGAESVSSPRVLLTVAQVAEQLRVSRRWVRRLIAGERLSATKRGREWLIDEESVTEYQAGRPIDE